MKKIITFLYCIVFSALMIISFAEILSQPQIKHYDNWIFGSRTGITFNTPDGNPEAISLGDYIYPEGTISFSDDNGDLLYHLDLFFRHSILKKNKGFFSFTDTIWTTNSVSNTGLFIQDISNSNLLHLFTVDVNSRFSNQDTINYGVNYLLIDKVQNNVIEEKNLFVNSTEKFAAVYNEIDKVVWIVTHEYGNDVFNIYKIDEKGFDEKVIKQEIGLEHKSKNIEVAAGRINFSPNGTTLAVTIPYYDPELDGEFNPDVQIFNFDPKTGVLSNPRELKINKNTYATCFSQNGKVLYVKVDNAIYQYDLTICDWDEMIDKKHIITTQLSPNTNAIERGPNGIIYCGRDRNTYLDAILNPDVVGVGCNYRKDVVSLGWQDKYHFFWGLPTLLNSYFTGEYDKPCAQEVEEESDYTISYPTPACLGDEYEIRINSDDDEEFSAEVKMVWPQEILIGEFNSFNSEIVFYDKYDYDENIQYQRFFEAIIKKDDIITDTLKYNMKYWRCCDNTVRNGSFMAHSINDNITGYCKAIDYSTDLDFREDPDNPCPRLFTAFGQIASSSSAQLHHPNFYKSYNFTSLMLIGDPLPNVPQRAWYQNNPTRKGTRYKFTTYVCNVEKELRFPISPLRKLNFWLGIKNRNQDLQLRKLEDVKYEDDWIELSDEFIAEDNTTELAVWVEGLSPAADIPSYGFAIDDVSLIPLPDYSLESAKDTIICKGEIDIKLENSFTGDIAKIEWSPTTGLDNPNSITPVASPTESTTYTLKITDKYYCEFVSDIVVEVDPCLEKCTPDISVYLTDKDVMIGDEFCINGVFIPECEIETYLDSIVIYFEFNPRLLKFESASTDYEIIKLQDKFILKLKFDDIDFILNQENEFTFCFTALLGSSKVTVLEVTEEERYNLADFTNSTIKMEACDQPFRQIKLIIQTDFEPVLDENNLKINLSTEEQGQFEFLIIDVNGKVIKQDYFTTNKEKYRQEEILIINLEDLPAGNYFIRMIAPSGKFYTKQFVKV